MIIRLFDQDVDVSQWQDSHPGGRKLFKIFENRDATQQFVAIHKGNQARLILKKLPQTPSKQKYLIPDAEKEFNELIKKLEPELNKVNILYELAKVVYVILSFFGGYALCFNNHHCLGLTMMCLAMYQSGWIGHDYSHRSVLKSPVHNNLMADFLGWIQGYSDVWWKLRHNTHHMTTNEIGNDPDIRTEPVFHFFDAEEGKDHRHIPLQQFLFPVFLSILDIFWRYETIMVIMKDWKRCKWIAARLAVHYIMLASLIILTPVTVKGLICLVLARGFMTASVVFANHYPEHRLNSHPSVGLFQQTLETTRNTTGFLLHSEEDTFFRMIFNECTGYLSMQIEHHLVPTWPAGNLMKLRPHIMELARKHNISYKESSLIGALSDNMFKLSSSNNTPTTTATKK